MKIQSILAVTDLSIQGQKTIDRAAMIAAHHRALLKIMVAWADFSGTAVTQAAAELARLTAQVSQRFGILVKAVGATSGGLQAVAEEARWADLLVVGEHLDRSAAAFFCGQPVERLLRRVRCPVLVARRAVLHRYRRILVAVDFTPASRQLVSLASSLDSAADLELFHALTTTHEGKLRYADVSERATRAYVHACARDAQARMFSLSDSSTARRNRVRAALGRGDVARQAVIQQQNADAELLVLGKHRASALADFFFGSVAQRALRYAGGDLLLMPHDLRVEPGTPAQALRDVGPGRGALPAGVNQAVRLTCAKPCAAHTAAFPRP